MELENLNLSGVKFYKNGDDTFGKVDFFNSYCIYPLKEVTFEKKASTILMDLDGTTVDSEEFWVYIIELTLKEILNNNKFSLEDSDLPYVSGYTTIDHLNYCKNKYCVDIDVEKALKIYHKISERELALLMDGKGNINAFKPKPDLKEFLLTVKSNNAKLGLATSGLDYKAIPEIVSIFKKLNLGDPFNFYDAIITGGKRKDIKDYGTLGEIVAKPHPFIYTELAKMGLNTVNSNNIIGIEDSSAGVLSLRFAGFAVIGLNNGNISKSGVDKLCFSKADTLSDILKIIF